MLRVALPECFQLQFLSTLTCLGAPSIFRVIARRALAGRETEPRLAPAQHQANRVIGSDSDSESATTGPGAEPGPTAMAALSDSNSE